MPSDDAVVTKNEIHGYTAFTIYAVLTYCFLDFLMPCVAAVGATLGMELEPQFDRPYLSASLLDFSGRRWNLMASAMLRPRCTTVLGPASVHRAACSPHSSCLG